MISKQNYEEKNRVSKDSHIKGAKFCTNLKLFYTEIVFPKHNFKANMYTSKSYFQNIILA